MNQLDIQNKTIPIDALRAHDRNYRKHPQQQLDRIAKSLSRFSQYRSIVVQQQEDGQYRIVAGHGLVLAAEQQGLTELRADILPSYLDEDEIVGILIADNETSRMAQDDDDLLAQLLQDQKNAGFDLESMGADDALLEDLLAKSEPPPSLDDLADEYGDKPDDAAFWPVIRLKVDPDTKERFDSLMAQIDGENEAEKFATLLSVVDIAAIGTEDDEDEDA